jgi:hypothetical protein
MVKKDTIKKKRVVITSKQKNSFLKQSSQVLTKRIHNFLKRRPHRSFRRTLKRDYRRSLKLPGYFSFTFYVVNVLKKNKKIFLSLIFLYALLSGLLFGLGSQEVYASLSDTLNQLGGDLFMGQFEQVSQTSILLTSLLAGSLNSNLTDVQWLYSTILIIFLWLTTVWLLRAIQAGRTPRLRDGIYNAGAPVIATFLLFCVFVLQLLPFAVAAIGISAAIASGLTDVGILSFLVWTIAVLLTVLSLYWMTSTILALVVITLPGMYPMQALKTASDLVIGRRLRILYRLGWLVIISLIGWGVVMFPIVLLDTWLKHVLPSISWLPIVPVALLLVSSLMVVWMTSYVYLLYRKVVDDDASPA